MRKTHQLIACGILAVSMHAVEVPAATQADAAKGNAAPAPSQPAAAKPAVPAKAEETPQVQYLTGKVVEVIGSSGYTYILLEREGKKKWIALPETEVKVGQQVEVIPGTEMGQFVSKSLNRTFDDIHFSIGLKSDKAGEKKPSTVAATGQMPAGHPGGSAPHAQGMPGMPAKAAAAEAQATLSGTVAETMDGGGYTYVSLENGGKKTWVAIPATKVKVGEKLELMTGAEMPNFTSKALNRTFEKVIFSGGVVDKK